MIFEHFCGFSQHHVLKLQKMTINDALPLEATHGDDTVIVSTLY